jgi:hypothetical protein
LAIGDEVAVATDGLVIVAGGTSMRAAERGSVRLGDRSNLPNLRYNRKDHRFDVVSNKVHLSGEGDPGRFLFSRCQIFVCV